MDAPTLSPRRPAGAAPALASLALATIGVAPLAGQAAGTAFTGATIWDGSGRDPVPDATLFVRDGRVVSIERGGAVPAGAEAVDVSGRWIVPGLVDTHAHASGRWAPEGVMDPAEALRGDLRLFARYGVTTVNSLGGEPLEARALREEEEAGTRAVRARLTFAGPVVTATTPEAARAAVTENASLGVDWIKLRVDDNLGTSPKMAWPAVAATIEAAHARTLPVATHLFYLADAKRLLEMGTDLVAHSVRDAPVDDELVALLRERDVCYVPTLTREVSTFIYAERPDFFNDPFFLRWADRREVGRLDTPETRTGFAESPGAVAYREALAVARDNLRALHAAGVRIAFGTDAGPAARFPGYFEHMELELMVEAGLTPADALRSATGVAAACLGRDDVGVLEPGRRADFLVLAADPLVDVRATRTLEAVYVGGRRVP